MFHEESEQGFFELERVQREFESANLSEFKTDLIAVLGDNGFFVNEYGLNNVLLHLAIALERSANLQPVLERRPAPPAHEEAISGALSMLVERHFAVALSTADVDHLTNLLTTRVLTPGQDQSITDVVSNFVDLSTLALVRRLVSLVHDEYLIDLDDDEIAYLALHAGSYLERRVRREDKITCALVCPNDYDIHVLLRQHIEHALGDVLDIDVVITRTDVDWSTMTTDLG